MSIIRSLIIGLSIVLLYLCFFADRFDRTPDAPPNSNRLVLGDSVEKDEPVFIIIEEPEEFDGLTKLEILHRRIFHVAQHSLLVKRPYVPSEAVFGHIEDGRPWWGIEGQYFYGSGAKSVEGASEESRFVSNPYLLAAAWFWKGTYWIDSVSFDVSRLSEPHFPFYVKPKDLVWWPKRRLGQVTYMLSDFAERRNGYAEAQSTTKNTRMGLDCAYNARDLNLNYLAFDLKNSKNVEFLVPPKSPIHQIVHYIHRGGSCGYPGGCNNMSPTTPDLDGLLVREVPAELLIRFWQAKPASPLDDADFSFLIRIR